MIYIGIIKNRLNHNKFRKIVGIIKKSTKLLQELRRICTLMNTEYKKIQSDNDTRWNSTLKMLRSFKHLWGPLQMLASNFKIENFIPSNRNIPIGIFSDICSVTLDELINLLEIFEKYTLIIEGDTEPTILEGSLIYNKLFTLLNENRKESNTKTLNGVITLMSQTLQKV